MKIGLAPYRFKNRNIAYNIRQMETALSNASDDISLLCFGEAFLQGFDAFCWEYAQDKEIAVTQSSETMASLSEMTLQYKTAVAFGYLERDGESLYSSYAVLSGGAVLCNYRRITKGWKEFTLTDDHYREGNTIPSFTLDNKHFSVALCGDLWDEPWRFRGEHILLWPLYVNYSVAEWNEEMPAYAAQAALASGRVLMINSLSGDPASHGGAFDFHKGQIQSRLPFDQEGILVAEV